MEHNQYSWKFKNEDSSWYLFDITNSHHYIASVKKCNCTFCNGKFCAEITCPTVSIQELFKDAEKAKLWVAQILDKLE